MFPKVMATYRNRMRQGSGGWGGIRTHEGFAPLPVFKTGAFDRSATHPRCDIISPPARIQGRNASMRLFDLAPPFYAIGRSTPFRSGAAHQRRGRDRRAGVAELVDARGLGPRG